MSRILYTKHIGSKEWPSRNCGQALSLTKYAWIDGLKL